MSSTATTDPAASNFRASIPALLLVILFAFQVRFPPLSYPALGQFILVILATLILLTAARVLSPKTEPAPASSPILVRHPALLPGFLFVAWSLFRWLGDGAPADGAATVGTIFWAAAFLLSTILLTRDQPRATDTGRNQMLSTSAVPRYWLYGISLLGLVCGLYAVAQYGWLYKQSYDALIEAIGPRPPDRSEAALLHHLNLRRVASFWGDPNSYAAFAALAFAASLEIFSLQTRLRLLWQTIAAVSMVAGVAGMFYTGSRGGVLDLLLVLALYVCMALLTRRRRSVAPIALLVMLPVFALTPCPPLIAQESTSGSDSIEASTALQTSSQPGWIWRSDTIRERVYYLEVGAKMIRMSPIIGLGPGSVNDYFGRLKNPNAREARNLHNWPVNTWAELGAIGLGLLTWFLGAITYGFFRARLWRHPVYRCYGVLFCVLLFDGLLQTSWSQRELMCLLGVTCGIIITASSTPAPITRVFVIRRAATAIVIALTLLILEIPYLIAASDKQIAADAMLANQPKAALDYWKKASRWAPRDPEPYQARAQMAIAAGELSSANLLLTRALELNPESAVLHSESANLAVRLNQPEVAEKQIQRALDLYPSHPQYNLQYARLLQSRDQVQKAITYAERAHKYSYEPEESAEIMTFLSQLYAEPK